MPVINNMNCIKDTEYLCVLFSAHMWTNYKLCIIGERPYVYTLYYKVCILYHYELGIIFFLQKLKQTLICLRLCTFVTSSHQVTK